MTQLLDSVYFGRLDRTPFVVSIAVCSGAAALFLVALIVTAHNAEGTAVLAALQRSGNLLDAPGILLAHGVSEQRTAGVMTVLGIYLIAALFIVAARARDIGLWGWPSAFATLTIFLLAGLAEVWVGSLAIVLAACFVLFPSYDRG